MPQHIKRLTKDLLSTMDKDIMDVEHHGTHLKLTLSHGEYLTFTEQDLVTLRQFLNNGDKER